MHSSRTALRPSYRHPNNSPPAPLPHAPTHTEPNARQSHLSQHRPLTLPDPSLPDLIRNVLLDVETHLSEEIVAERLCAFEEEAAAQVRIA